MAWWPRLSSSSSAAEPPAGPARGDEDADRPDRQATGHVPAATTPRLEVGRIEKVHGLRGEVVVQLVTNLAAARTAPGAVLWAGGDALQVVTARRHRNRWLIAFDGVTDRDTAEGLRGRPSLPRPWMQPMGRRSSPTASPAS